jgi:hypothetical protein
MAHETEYKQLVATISNQLGRKAATLFQQLYHLAHTKQPCDICLSNGTVFLDVTIGADFVYALEFEASVETVLQMLSRIKIVTGIITPVVSICLENINALISMPKKKFVKADVSTTSARPRLSEQGSSGETLEEFIRKTYQPKTEDELHYYAARYLAAHDRMKENET